MKFTINLRRKYTTCLAWSTSEYHLRLPPPITVTLPAFSFCLSSPLGGLALMEQTSSGMIYAIWLYYVKRS